MDPLHSEKHYTVRIKFKLNYKYSSMYFDCFDIELLVGYPVSHDFFQGLRVYFHSILPDISPILNG